MSAAARAHGAKALFRFRARILSGIFVLFALLLIARLYFVQVINGQNYARDAMGQYAAIAPDTEDRGDIFLTREDGEYVAGAVMQSGWRIAVVPKDIEDPAATFEKIDAATKIDRERFFQSVAKTDDPYEEVAFRVNDDAAQAIRLQKIPGLLLVQDQWRLYPGNDLAAHVIGFVGYRGDRKEGVYGLERKWQDVLARSAASHYVNPFAEIFTNIGELLANDPNEQRGDVITSIEPAVQKQLEDAIEDIRARYAPRTAGGIVMDPRSGEILALAARPSFDPNTYNTVADAAVFVNPIVESIYEMGSIMKPLTMAAGIDTAAVSPTTTYEDKGFVMKSGKRVSNFDKKARGVVNMQEVLNQSLNTGASFVVDRMGQDTFADYIRSYGLGEKTGIDLPNEATGSLQALSTNSDVDFASASFGQGLAVSPIAMVRGLSVLANAGKLPNPHVTTAIRHRSGVVKDIPQREQREVLKPDTTETLTRMLVKVYDTALLGGELKQEHYSIAAKTGTAQIAIPGGGGYYEGRYLHSFFGYFPAYEPRFIVFLFAVEPQREIYASHTLAKPFLDIAKFLINYYEVPPDR